MFNLSRAMAKVAGARGLASLSPETVKIVKATAPVLADHGYAITRTMYKKMLGENPEVKAMFNPSHQVELGGEKARQPWTLASAVHAYAANVDNLGALTEAVERIAHKHVSLHVLPEQYPVVGENLLWAISETLGDAATPEILAAWKEAYEFLADIFINREREIREANASAEGGWEGWRDFKVSKKVKESDEICSFYLKSADGKPIASFLPGQYTAVRFETPEFTTQRNYTVSTSPGRQEYRITVKREPPFSAGAPVGHISNHLHDNVNEGDIIKLTVPCGDFVLNIDNDKPIVLLSGGVGITPILSMLESLIETKVKNNIIMVTSTRNPSVEAMHELLAKYRRKHLNLMVKNLYDDGPEEYPKGPLTEELLSQILVDKDCNYYFCGTPGYMKNVISILKRWEIPKEQYHFEFFGPHQELLD